MTLIAWTDSLLVGVESIDNEHKALLELINRLHTAISTARGEDEIRSILFLLSEYALSHFAVEETAMAEIGYPDLGTHRAEHAVFAEKLDILADKVRRGETETAESTFRFLVDWLIDHVSKTDMAMGAFLRKRAG